jgi:predicted lipase
VVAHALSPSTQEAGQVCFHEVEASRVYRLSSRTVTATQRSHKPCLKKTKTKTKTTTTKKTKEQKTNKNKTREKERETETKTQRDKERGGILQLIPQYYEGS